MSEITVKVDVNAAYVNLAHGGSPIPIHVVEIQSRGVIADAAVGRFQFIEWQNVYPADAVFLQSAWTKVFVEEFYTRWNRGDMGGVAELIHPRYVDYIEIGGIVRRSEGVNGFLSDREAGKQYLKGRFGNPGVRITVLDLFASGFKACVRVNALGEFVAPHPLYGGQVGDEFVLHAISIFELLDGKLFVHHEKSMVMPRGQ